MRRQCIDDIIMDCERSQIMTVRWCQRGWAGRPWATSLFWTGPGPAQPPKSLTFINELWARLAHPNPSLLSTGPSPLQIPHFCRPDLSLLSARPGGVTPALPQTAPLRGPTERQPLISPGLAPSLFGKPSCECQESLRSGWLASQAGTAQWVFVRLQVKAAQNQRKQGRWRRRD